MTYLVVGASAGLGRALSRRLAEAGHDLILVASDARDVIATCRDLEIRFGRRAIPVAVDVSDRDAYLDQLHRAVTAAGEIDGLLFPIGAIADDDDATLEATAADWLTGVNFSSVVWAVAALLPLLERRPQSCIVGFGSIAAIRGRRRNVVYAAAKSGLATFFESLRHRCVGTRIHVQFYVVGYLDTALTFGRPTLLPPANPDRLSRRVIRNLGRDIGTAYHPRGWRLARIALPLVPWPLFQRLRF